MLEKEKGRKHLPTVENCKIHNFKKDAKKCLSTQTMKIISTIETIGYL